VEHRIGLVVAARKPAGPTGFFQSLAPHSKYVHFGDRLGISTLEGVGGDLEEALGAAHRILGLDSGHIDLQVEGFDSRLALQPATVHSLPVQDLDLGFGRIAVAVHIAAVGRTVAVDRIAEVDQIAAAGHIVEELLLEFISSVTFITLSWKEVHTILLLRLLRLSVYIDVRNIISYTLRFEGPNILDSLYEGCCCCVSGALSFLLSIPSVADNCSKFFVKSLKNDILAQSF
jgi:hypothetical protein